MPRPDIDLLLIDIDGCLLPGTAAALDYRSFTAVREYCVGRTARAKPALVLCTGRPQPYAAALINVLGAARPRRPSVVEAGAYLYYPAESRARRNRVLTPALLTKWKTLRQTIRDQAAALQARPGLGEKLGLSLIPAGLDVTSLFHRVQEKFAGVGYIEITHSSMCVDIAPKGINKRTGILQLAAETGLDTGRMLGIGDSINDLKMLDTVGVPACPANAHPRVKAKCVYISPYPYTTGIWDIIQRYALGK